MKFRMSGGGVATRTGRHGSRTVAAAVTPTYFEATSWRSWALGTGARLTVRPVLGLWAHLPFDLFPPNLAEKLASGRPAPAGTRVDEIALRSCPAELIRGQGVGDRLDRESGAILYLHGGAFLCCGLNTHRGLVSRISAAAGVPVLNVGYRQMPEAPISWSLADAMDGFAWLLDQGYEPADITIAGDSAGGYLAFALARAVLDAGWGRPAGVAALSPVLQVDPVSRRQHRNAERCQLFPAAALDRFASMIRKVDAKHGVLEPLVDPVDMDVSDLPPTLIQVGSREMLMADAELMASRLAAAGVPVDLQVWSRQVHVFHAAASWLPEARAAVEEVATFIDQAMGSSVRSAARRTAPTKLAR